MHICFTQFILYDAAKLKQSCFLLISETIKKYFLTQNLLKIMVGLVRFKFLKTGSIFKDNFHYEAISTSDLNAFNSSKSTLN